MKEKSNHALKNFTKFIRDNFPNNKARVIRVPKRISTTKRIMKILLKVRDLVLN